MEEKQKKVPAKRIQLVDVVLEGKGSQLFSGRRVDRQRMRQTSFEISSGDKGTGILSRLVYK